LPPKEYHDTVQAHTTFKEIIDRLKAQKISRDDIQDRLRSMDRTLTKSTITRHYSDPVGGKTHSLKLLRRYTDWIKEAYPKELGLEIDEPIAPYDQIKELRREIKALRRINSAILIRLRRSKYGRR